MTDFLSREPSATLKRNPLVAAIDAAEGALLRLDQAHSGLALFAAMALLFLLMLAPTAFNGNEEQYFQMGYRRVAPEQFTQYHSMFDSSNARIVSETVIGKAVLWFGYEYAHAVLRCLLALLYSLGLAMFFSAVGVAVLEALFIVAVFCTMGEQLLGAEWLFKGVETKTLAYGLVIPAFALACRQRWVAAVALTAGATYLHFLVGGFWTLLLLLFQSWQQREMRPVAKNALLFVIVVTPLLLLIAPQSASGLLTTTSQGLTADFIYAQIRAPYHMAPFVALYSFWAWLPGVVIACALIAVLSGLQRNKLLPAFGFVPLTGLLYLLLALVVAYFDRHTQYLGKLYLFRPSSLTLFFAIAAIVVSFRREGSNGSRYVFVLVCAAFVGVYLFGVMKTQIDIMRTAPAIPYERELVDEIEQNSSPQDIVLLEPFNEMDTDFERLHRLIPRPTLVSWKFVPTIPAEILRWYELIQKRERLFATGCAEPMQPPVRLLVVFSEEVAERMRQCGELVWQRGNTSLIRVRTVAP